MAPEADSTFAATSSGTLLGSWLHWGSKSKAAPDATSTAASQQAQQAQQQLVGTQADESTAGDGVPDLNGQWEKNTTESDMDAYAKQVAMLHMSR